MPRKIIAISVTAQIEAFVKYRVTQGGYASVSEYFRELLRRDKQVEIAKRQAAAGQQPPTLWQP